MFKEYRVRVFTGELVQLERKKVALIEQATDLEVVKFQLEQLEQQIVETKKLLDELNQ